MEKKENSEVVKLGLLNRFILGAKSLSLSENGVYLDDKFVEFPKPLQKSQYMQGLVFDKLVWGEDNYLFIKNNALRIVFSDLETKKIQYWSPIYKEYFDQIVDVSEKYEKYINSLKRYIRRSHIENWIERLSASKNQLSQINDYNVLGFDINKIKPALLEFLSNPDGFVIEKNAVFIKNEFNSTNHLFDQLEEHPLTERQREACIHDEDNVLVIAGAGTGKTSTMRAKAAYLVQQGYARAEEILMLAYGKDARQELEERVYELDGLNGVVIRTFHSLGKEIIGHYENRATNVSVLASDDAQYIKFIDNQIEKMVNEPSLEKAISSFFSEYIYPEPSDLEFKSHGEYLKYTKDNEIRDLAGNLVKSFEELKISYY